MQPCRKPQLPVPLGLTLLLAAGEEIQCLLVVVALVAAVGAVMGHS